MIQQVATDLASRLPVELVNALLSSYEEVKQNYFLGKHEPSELNGGKFCEACVRILQLETGAGVYTPLGVSISNMLGELRDFEKLPQTAANESYRIHIPRVLIAIYNIRNKRGVGHLGGDINPNVVDATIIASCADWVMAELFRIHYQCTLDEAQQIANSLVQRRLVLVYEFEQIRRVLLPSLSHSDQTLLILASLYPEKASEENLLIWIEPANQSRYKSSILSNLHAERLIEYDERAKWCVILPTGLKYVTSRYPTWLAQLNKEE
jgi:hypothetical protein